MFTRQFHFITNFHSSLERKDHLTVTPVLLAFCIYRLNEEMELISTPRCLQSLFPICPARLLQSRLTAKLNVPCKLRLLEFVFERKMVT